MNTAGKVLAVFFAGVTIYTTYPRVIEALVGPPRASAPASAPGPGLASQPTTRTDFAAQEQPPRVVVPTPGTREFGRAPVPYVWQEKGLRSPNLATFVREALPAAEAGNADAQFALYGAFSFCRDGMMKRTAAELHRIPEAIMSEMHRRCDDLAAAYPDLPREAARWLESSVQAKFPRAFAYSALEDLERLEHTKMKKADREKLLTDSRSRMVIALHSNDPAITWIAAESLAALFPGDARIAQANWVWRLAACEQGLECGANARWLHDDCQWTQDCVPGETGPEYIRRVSGDFSSLQARARTLAASLRNSTLDDAGFAATVTSLPAPRARSEESRRPSARLAR